MFGNDSGIVMPANSPQDGTTFHLTAGYLTTGYLTAGYLTTGYLTCGGLATPLRT